MWATFVLFSSQFIFLPLWAFVVLNKHDANAAADDDDDGDGKHELAVFCFSKHSRMHV